MYIILTYLKVFPLEIMFISSFFKQRTDHIVSVKQGYTKFRHYKNNLNAIFNWNKITLVFNGGYRY